MIKRFASFAAVLAALSFASQANAAYTLTLSGLAPPSMTVGGTTFDFTAPPTTQTGIFSPQSFNLVNITEPTADGGSGTVSVSENFTLSSASFTETGTLSFVIKFTGGTSSLMSSTVTVGSGSGFSFLDFNYSKPTPFTASGGSISTDISTVPEPASIAMLGLGLAGVGAYGLRRRRSAK